MALVAWTPKGMQAPVELTAVMIKPGEVTHSDWTDALADRVTGMAQAAKNPQKATLIACQSFDLPTTDDPTMAGEYLVKGNLNLIEHFACSVYDDEPFPTSLTEEDEEARSAIEGCDFEFWIELAHQLTSTSSLD